MTQEARDAGRACQFIQEQEQRFGEEFGKLTPEAQLTRILELKEALLQQGAGVIKQVLVMVKHSSAQVRILEESAAVATGAGTEPVAASEPAAPAAQPLDRARWVEIQVNRPWFLFALAVAASADFANALIDLKRPHRPALLAMPGISQLAKFAKKSDQADNKAKLRAQIPTAMQMPAASGQ